MRNAVMSLRQSLLVPSRPPSFVAPLGLSDSLADFPAVIVNGFNDCLRIGCDRPAQDLPDHPNQPPCAHRAPGAVRHPSATRCSISSVSIPFLV
jgi:hypothetical protein